MPRQAGNAPRSRGLYPPQEHASPSRPPGDAAVLSETAQSLTDSEPAQAGGCPRETEGAGLTPHRSLALQGLREGLEFTRMGLKVPFCHHRPQFPCLHNGDIWDLRFPWLECVLPKSGNHARPIVPKETVPSSLSSSTGTLTGPIGNQALPSPFCPLQKPPPKMPSTLGYPSTANAQALRTPGQQTHHRSDTTTHQFRAHATAPRSSTQHGARRQPCL